MTNNTTHDYSGLLDGLASEAIECERWDHEDRADLCRNAKTAIETLTRELAEVKRQSNLQTDEYCRLREELADAAFARDNATRELTATKERLAEAVQLLPNFDDWQGNDPQDDEQLEECRTFLAKQEASQ